MESTNASVCFNRFIFGALNGLKHTEASGKRNSNQPPFYLFDVIFYLTYLLICSLCIVSMNNANWEKYQLWPVFSMKYWKNCQMSKFSWSGSLASRSDNFDSKFDSLVSVSGSSALRSDRGISDSGSLISRQFRIKFWEWRWKKLLYAETWLIT